MLKSLLTIITAASMLAACNTTSTQHNARPDSVSTEAQPKTDSREDLPAAFRDLKNRLADKSGQELAAIMSFPLREDIFSIVLEDSVFNAAYASADHTLSKAMFLKYFPSISESLQLPEFSELFRQVKIEKLLRSDTARGEIRIANEPCLRFYTIQLRHDTATISYGSDHNDTYKKAGEEDEDVCEWATIWEFRIDGRKLHLLRMFQAG